MTGMLASARAILAWLPVPLAHLWRLPYLPPTLLADGERVAVALSGEYEAARQSGAVVMRAMLSSATGPDAPDVAANVRCVAAELDNLLASADPDALAAGLVEHLCIGVSGMDGLDNRRRVVAIWSAILAPSVVIREHGGVPIVLADLVDVAIDWVRFGYTSAARTTSKTRATRFICRHPARVYQLVADRAHAAGIDHGELMISLLRPVLVSLGELSGALDAVERAAKMVSSSKEAT